MTVFLSSFVCCKLRLIDVASEKRPLVVNSADVHVVKSSYDRFLEGRACTEPCTLFKVKNNNFALVKLEFHSVVILSPHFLPFSRLFTSGAATENTISTPLLPPSGQ